MAKLWDTLSPLSKVQLAKLYKKLTGLDYQPPKEDLHEIERMMKEKPPYTINKQGRE